MRRSTKDLRAALKPIVTRHSNPGRHGRRRLRPRTITGLGQSRPDRISFQPQPRDETLDGGAPKPDPQKTSPPQAAFLPAAMSGSRSLSPRARRFITRANIDARTKGPTGMCASFNK